MHHLDFRRRVARFHCERQRCRADNPHFRIFQAGVGTVSPRVPTAKGCRIARRTGCNACACDVAALAKGSRFHKFAQRQGTCLSGSESQKENSMKHIGALALALGMALGVERGARAGCMAQPSHHFHCALWPRWLHRPGRPPDRPLRREDLGQAGRGRKPRGRRRHRGDTVRRERGTRRIHILRLQRRRRLDRAVCPKARIRSSAGPGAGGHRQLNRAGGHRQEGSAGKVDGRAGRVCEGQSRQAQLRLQRRRRLDALFRRAVPGPYRHQGGAYPIQGRCAVDCGGACRRGRLFFRQHDRRSARRSRPGWSAAWR